jgi:hypothetical protein
VLGVSCILAALIIASSSFAWFTSKDEVTNRLSASGDYDVRIVESFAPPANWLPGQEVNKDVYAVNTGSVEAFVEESVSGALTVTREKATNGLTRPDTDCIELSPAEVYAIEAGSYLALVPENSNFEAGNKVVAMNPDFADENGYTSAGHGDFDPDAEGLYVFRRVIDYPDAIHNGGNKQIETFEYDAYYFVPGMTAVEQVQDSDENGNLKWTKHKIDQTTPEADSVVTGTGATKPTEDGYEFTPVYKAEPTPHDAIKGKYYKVSNLTVTPDAELDLAGDGKNTDGNLARAAYGFYKEDTVTINPTDLKYEAKVTGAENSDDNHPNRLVVTYDLGKDYNNLKVLAKARDDANRAYEDAVAEYKAAVRDLEQTADPKGTNPKLTEATNALQDAIDKMRVAENVKKAAEDLVTEKTKARDAAQAALEAAQGKQADAQQAYNDAAAAYDAADLAKQQAYANKTAAGTALGDKDQTASDDDSASAWQKYLKAKANFDTFVASNANAKANFDAAFTAYVSDNSLAGVTQDNVTYEQLLAMNLDKNNDDGAYQYWRLLVALKEAEENKADAQEAYDNAVAELAQKTKEFNTADDNKTAAQTALDVANGAVGDSNSGAQKAFNDAQAALGDAKAKLGTADDDASNDDGASAWAKYKNAQNELENARTAYDTALENANADKTQLKAAEKNYAEAAQALKNAEIAYDRAAAENDGKINIYINLSDNVVVDPGTAEGEKWQLLPASLVDTDGINGKDTARFYYTSILGGGQTSTKLIDSVELDKNVTQDMFKYLDFDLNVDLKSAQIAMDSDGETILTTAADTILDAKAALANPTSLNTAITWDGEAPATPSSYTAAAQKSGATNPYDDPVTITRLTTPVKVGDNTYMYKISTTSDGDFYGNALTANATFVKAGDPVVNPNEYALDNSATVKLNENATPVAP